MGDHHLHSPPPSPDVDYISNLHDSLLLHILCFLSTHDSVRTSVLARRWRSLWASVPTIVFDYYDFHPEAVSRADEIIHQFVASRRNSSAVFSLSINLSHVCPGAWIDYAKSHGVQSVALCLCYYPLQSPIFDTLFNCPSLVVLNLQFDEDWPRVDIPPECIALSNLKTLSLTLGVFSEESMRMLLACCLNLQDLRLDLTECYDAAIEIALPKLRTLLLTSTLSKTHINCPILESLCIGGSSFLEEFHAYVPSLFYLHFGPLRWCHPLFSSLCNAAELGISLVSLPADLEEHLSIIESFKFFHKIQKFKVHLHLRYEFTMQLLFLFLLEIPDLHTLHLMDETYEEEPFSPFSLIDDGWREFLQIMPSRSFNNLKLVLVQIQSESARSTILEMLSEKVQEWDRVVVRYSEFGGE
ncbi:hypothetical protein ZIOFF_020317 [Zingiber officinale]|uniref:F-box/LRR-repeat protein n=1 Tax=Zingiber officinale TaxID=94328 RepID=A0A8J5H9N4_ZINOF|nr:hypothetical protein ZIOFF_020317 [Zingiber officinale]